MSTIGLIAALAGIGGFFLAVEKRLREHRQNRESALPRARGRTWARVASMTPAAWAGIGAALLALAIAALWADSGSRTQERERPEVESALRQQTVVSHPQDTDNDSVPDSRDRCVRVAGTQHGCPRSDLHPAWRPPEKALYRFLVDGRNLDPIPCMQSRTRPGLASGGLLCTVRQRPIHFFRFRSAGIADHYLVALRNKEAAPASVGDCQGESRTWEVAGSVQGPLAFLRRHRKFLAVWGYENGGDRNVGLIRGPMSEAGAICLYWEQEAF